MSAPHAGLDFESAPIAPVGLPTHEITSADIKDEKKVSALQHPGNDAITVSAANGLDADEEEPTEEEYRTLRKLGQNADGTRVAAPMKWVAIAMCFIELAERASYYGCQYVFGNFVRGPLPVGGNGAGAVAPGDAGLNQSAGALGRGSVPASAITSTFTFFAYLTPILGGIIADTKLGRFKTICIGTAIGVIVHVLLVIPAIPSIIPKSDGQVSFGLFVLFVIMLAFAAGFIKPSLGPLLCDQSPVKRATIQVTKKGERVILDPTATVQRYLLIFYWCINLGAMFGLATTYSERLVGFWLAFLEPGILYAFSPLVLWWAHKRLYKAPPQGSVALEAWRVFTTSCKDGGWKNLFRRHASFWDHAKPSYIMERDGTIDRSRVFWDDLFVDEIKQSISACATFMLIPIFNLADGGIGNQLNSQSAAMRLDGLPNDILNNFNSLAILVATPAIVWGLYPFFEKIGRPIKPMTRMFIGFQLASINMIFGAIIQWKIYQTSPCGYYASTCDEVSPVSLWWQLTEYGIPAVGEIFVNVTSYELAYTRAPARMKGLVYAICLFSSAISSAIGLAASAAITDPYLIWPAVALAVACFVTAFVFPIFFKHLNEPLRDFQNPERQAGLQQPNVKAHHDEEEQAYRRSEEKY